MSQHVAHLQAAAENRLQYANFAAASRCWLLARALHDLLVNHPRAKAPCCAATTISQGSITRYGMSPCTECEPA